MWLPKTKATSRFISVGGHVLCETLAPQKAIHVSDVPRSHLEITPAWLTAVLCKEIPGALVLDFQATGGSIGTSTRQGLQLALNDEARQGGVPSRLFTKCSRNFNQRLMLGLSGMINGEIGFYPQIRPQLKIEAPKGYHACIDLPSWRSMILMEDVVATKGAKFISTETRITRAQMEDLLANMAIWHGHFWDSPLLKNQLRWLRTPTDFLNTIAPLGFRFLCMQGIKHAQSVIPPSLLSRTDELWKALACSFELNLQGPRTFLHGDPHIGQTYITNEGKMGYTDWQLVMQGGWAFDFTYALISALTVEDRRLWERDLLRFYLDRLHASGGPQLTFDDAWLCYRQNTIYPYFCWLMTIAGNHLPLMPNMQAERVSLDIIERAANTIVDLESLKAISR
jgi:Phosphotransferase enzyme family